MSKIRIFLIGILIYATSTTVYAQDVTRKQLQLMIRETISEAEFERMLQLKKTTPNGWSEIFDEVIEPEREAMEHYNRSQRRYIVPEGQNNAMRGRVDGASVGGPPSKLAIDVNAAPPDAAQEEPATVEVDPHFNKRQRLYLKDGRRAEDDNLQAAKGPIPATSMRRRLKAAQAAEADQALNTERSGRKARLYPSSRRNTKRTEEDDVESEEEETKEKAFGAKVLGREKKIIGAEEDRFEKFHKQKPIERKMFRSGSYDNNGRRIKMFGRDKDE